jgi:lipopolysaccharide transport system ATP-binding protein
MTKPVIDIENVGKRYRIDALREPYLSLRGEVMKVFSAKRRRARKEEEIFWALRDVSFGVQSGDAVGIIGRNGAGKSTLLKILSQITPPTEGKITMRGRVASLLEVGTGFHPELSGRENIYLNGAILGMSRSEVKRKFDEIVAFAEVDKFLDTPVKRYSSGMYVRLAFSVAAHLEPEVLVVDEVLAVGDAQFQKKCLGKMEDVARGGRTVLFVSHNMQAVSALCTRGVVLNNGRVDFESNAEEAIDHYLRTLFMDVPVADLRLRRDRRGRGSVRVTAISLYDKGGARVNSLKSGESCHIDFDYEALSPTSSLSIAFTVRDATAQYLFRPSSEDTGQDYQSVAERGRLRCTIPRLPLVPGQYRITPRLAAGGVEEDWVEGAMLLIVEGGDFFGSGRMSTHSPVILDHSWSWVESREDEGSTIG